MNQFKSLAAIAAAVRRRAAKIGARGELLPSFGHSQDFARPHIEVDAAGCHYVVVERGHEYSRHTTTDLDELFYMIFEDVTFSLASNFAAAHRAKRQDFRRILFRRQVELLSQLSRDWGVRQAAEHQVILSEHPFDDFYKERDALAAKLRAAGQSAKAARRAALIQYPLPKPSRTRHSS